MAGGSGSSAAAAGSRIAVGVGTEIEGRLSQPLPVRDARSRLGEAAGDQLLFGAQGSLLAPHDERQSRRDSARKKALAAADMAGVISAFGVMSLIVVPASPEPAPWTMLALPPLWVLLNVVLGLYHRDAHVIHRSSLDELPRLFNSLALGVLLILIFAEPLFQYPLGSTQTVVFLISALALTGGFRSVARLLVRRSFDPERVAILGAGQVAGMVARKLKERPEYGVEVVGLIDGRERTTADPWLPPRLGGPQQIESIVEEHGLERLVVAFGGLPHDELVDLIRTSKRLQLKITVVPRLYEVIGHRVEIDEIGGMTMLGMRSIGRPRSSLLLKRAIDVVGAAAGLILLSPLLFVIAAIVRLTSPGPVLYSQMRMGRDGRSFRMFKFRTMVADADRLKQSIAHLNETGGVLFKIGRDPRVTRFGRLLRRTSLDELPQLWNVLKGEMSLVGPRPLVPDEDGHCIGWHRTRLELTPGLTGPWQVSGRNSVPFQEMVKMDYLYVAEWSLWNDMRLLLRTMPVVLFGRGS